MPINQWHRTGSSLEANVVSFIYLFIFNIQKEILKSSDQIGKSCIWQTVVT